MKSWPHLYWSLLVYKRLKAAKSMCVRGCACILCASKCSTSQADRGGNIPTFQCLCDRVQSTVVRCLVPSDPRGRGSHGEQPAGRKSRRPTASDQGGAEGNLTGLMDILQLKATHEGSESVPFWSQSPSPPLFHHHHHHSLSLSFSLSEFVQSGLW